MHRVTITMHPKATCRQITAEFDERLKGAFKAFLMVSVLNEEVLAVQADYMFFRISSMFLVLLSLFYSPGDALHRRLLLAPSVDYHLAHN